MLPIEPNGGRVDSIEGEGEGEEEEAKKNMIHRCYNTSRR